MRRAGAARLARETSTRSAAPLSKRSTLPDGGGHAVAGDVNAQILAEGAGLGTHLAGDFGRLQQQLPRRERVVGDRAARPELRY